MLQYLVKRLLLMFVTLFGIAVITFVITRLSPGEPAGVALNTRQSDAVSYDDLVEQNRRNLGLDKPLVFNFNFEDRDYLARAALTDFIRPVYYWQEDAASRLRLSSTIAVKPALDMIEELMNAPDGVDHRFKPTNDRGRRIDVDASIRRILALLPNLARHRPEGYDELSREEQIAYWNKWIEENAARFEETEVRAAVERYLAGDGPIEDVISRGGYAIPFLIEPVNSGSDEVALRANNALTGLTGFTYLRTDQDWQTSRAEVAERWNSFWRRDKERFQKFSSAGNFINIFANTQFGVWMKQIIHLDFGSSYKYKRSVNRLMLERLPITIVLSVLSILFSYILSIPIGILSAIKRNTGTDRLVTVLLFILYSLPSFWTAQMLLLSLTGGPSPFGGDWPDLFPSRGVNSEGLDWQSGNPRAIVDMLWHVALPTLVLTYGSLAYLSRQMRNSMLESMNQDYIRTAMAKGLGTRTVIVKHALRNSLIPIITISAGLLPDLIAGSIIVESIFSIPGMGLLSFEAILNRDYPVVNAILFFSAFLTLLGILLADLGYALVDPRIRYE